MGDTNVIALLSKISMNLDRIVLMNTEAQSPKAQQENMTAALNSGSSVVASQTPKSPKAETARSEVNITGLSPAEVTKLLSTLPKHILSVASLEKDVMKKFSKTFTVFADTISKFNKVKVSTASAEATKRITESLLILNSVNFNRFSKDINKAEKNGFNKLFESTMKNIVSGLSYFEKVDASKIKPGVEAVTETSKLLRTLVSSVSIMMAEVIGVAVAIKFIGGAEIAKATGVVLGTVASLSLIAVGIAELSKLVGPTTMKDMSSIPKFIFQMQLLSLSTFALGMLFQTNTPLMLAGFTGISAMILGYTAVVTLSGLIASLVPIGIKSMKTVMLVAGMGVLLTTATLFMGVLAEDSKDEIEAGFTATSLIILGFSVVISVAAKIAKSTGTTLRDFEVIGAVAAGAEVLVLATYGLGHLVNSPESAWMVASGFGVTAALILGFTTVVKAASKVANGITNTTMLQLAKITALSAAVEPVVLGVIGMSYLMKDTDKIALLETLGTGAAVIGGVILMAKAANKLNTETATKAIIALGSLELLAAGTLGVVFLATKVAKAVNEVGNEAMLETLGYAAGIITGVGALAFAAGALVFGPQAVIFAAGLGAFVAIDLVVAASAATVTKFSEAVKAKESLTDVDINSFTGTFTTLTDALADMIGLKFVKNMAIVTASAPLITSVSTTIATVATCMSKVALVSGPEGKIRGVTIDNNGNYVYSEFVDIKSATVNISDSLKIFVETITQTFKTISLSTLVKSGVGIKIIGQMMEPVSLFAKTMLSFQDAGPGKIREVRFKEDGTLVDTPAVDVKQVSELISASISTFASTLFSEKNQNVWKRITEGERNANGAVTMVYAEKAMGVLATIISPVCEFASTLAMFESGDNNTIVVPIYGDNGVVTNRRTINVISVAGSIAGAVQKFATTLFSNSELWSSMYKSETHKTKKGGLFSTAEYETINTMESAVGVFSNVITPVISFTNMLSKLGSGEQDELLVFDASGNSRAVNVVDLATKIGSSVTTFVTTLTGKVSSLDSSSADTLKAATSSLQGIFTEFDKYVADEKNNSFNKFKTHVDNMTSAFKDFDKVLEDGESKRIASVKKLGQAFDDLRKKLNDAKSDLNEVKDIFESMNKVDTSNINTIIEKIAEKLKVTIDHTGNMTSTDVRQAIVSALDGATLQQYTFGSGKNERNRFELDLDDNFQH